MRRERPLVLIVEDEISAVRVMTLSLEKEGFEVRSSPDASAALAQLSDLDPDVVVIDYLLPGMSGLELLRYARRRSPDLPIVMITGHGDERLAVESMKLGAFMYLPKPLDYHELTVVIRRAVELHELKRDLRATRVASSAGQLVGRSPAMQKLRELIASIGPTEVTVLITGETGTGKEVVARSIHLASRRAQKKFVALNCSAIPETLLEAELFGHRRGAFTGAERSRDGRAITASGATLFLDEIGEMPSSIQPKFLRLLEDGEVTPLGSDTSQKVDLRVIAATNIDLRREAAAGRFRPDLFYRLNVLPVHIPPLRERREDIPELVHFILPKLARRHEKSILEIDPSLLDWLTGQEWRGNVRELENTLERLVILSRDGRLDCPEDPRFPFIAPYHQEKQEVIDAFERRYLRQALQVASGKLSEVSRRTGISPRQLYNLVRKHGLEEDSDRQSIAEMDETTPTNVYSMS